MMFSLQSEQNGVKKLEELSESSEEEEDFAWYSDKDPNNYFILTTRERNIYKKDQ